MNRIRTRLIASGLTALLGAGLGCGNEATAPAMPGAAITSLTTPNADDGAILVTVTGPGLANVQPAGSGYLVFWRLVSPQEVRALVVGDLGSGPLFTVDVPDLRRVGEYSGTVVEAASRADAVRVGVSGYAVKLAGPSALAAQAAP